MRPSGIKGSPVALTLNDLTVGFTHLPRDTLLKEWCWLIGTRKLPIPITLLGYVFVEDADDGSVRLLSVGPGTVSKVADDVTGFRQRLTQEDFVADNFVPTIVTELRGRDTPLQPGQLYSYRVPPVLGGKYVAENLEPTDTQFALLFAWADSQPCSLVT